MDYRKYYQSRRKQPGNELPQVLLVLYYKIVNAARRFATPQRRESDANASEKYIPQMPQNCEIHEFVDYSWILNDWPTGF